MYSLSILWALLIFALVVNAYEESITVCPKLPFNCFCQAREKGKEIVPCQRTNYVECRRTNYKELRSIFKTINQYTISEFEITTSSLTEVNKTMFTNVTLKTLEFKSSEIETFHIFEGLRRLKSLRTLIIDNVAVKNWVFTPADKIAGLKLMQYFVLMDCPGDSPNDTMIISFLPSKLELIKIRWCKLNLKDQNSFSRFSRLKYLDLKNNDLRFLNRSYLPNPADNLLEISLSYNPITSLSNDMFEGMPMLRAVELERTSLKGLSYNTFYPVLRKLSTFKITYNPLHCDCFNSWLIKEVSRWEMQMPTCQTPENMKNSQLNTVLPKEMCQPEGYEKTMEEYCATVTLNENQNVAK